MTGAQRLKRVFNIDIQTYKQCGGVIKLISSVEDPVIIEKTLSLLNDKKLNSTGLFV